MLRTLVDLTLDSGIRALRRYPRVVPVILMLGFTGSVWAEETPRFAPGATGQLEDLQIESILDRAKRLESGLAGLGQGNEDSPAARAANPLGDVTLSKQRLGEIEEMLGLERGSAANHASERKTGSRLLVFVSFSMPDASLRALGEAAHAAGASILFQGFSDSSIPVMGANVRRVFGEEMEIGFGIDPTAFSRFNITAVPAVVALKEPLQTCRTRHCKDDVTPDHDRIVGNATLPFMLETIAARGEHGVDAALVALATLDAAEEVEPSE